MKQISESKRNYIKAISELARQNNGAVRKTDIAKALGHSKASVTGAIRRLEQDGYVVQKRRNVLLSESGKEISESLREKKIILARLFESLGDDKEDAAENADRMESMISEGLLNAIKEALKAKDTASISAVIG